MEQVDKRAPGGRQLSAGKSEEDDVELAVEDTLLVLTPDELVDLADDVVLLDDIVMLSDVVLLDNADGGLDKELEEEVDDEDNEDDNNER